MSGTVITVTSGKGGVGKTTTSANVAIALAMAGKRVIAVDADIGLRNLDLVMGLENRIIYDLVDVIEGRCQLQHALVRDNRVESLYLLAAAQSRDKSDVGIQQMVSVCQTLKQTADYVVIDSPAGIEHGFQSAIAPSDRVLIVTTADVSALRDADKVIYLLERDWKHQPGLVVNRYNVELSRDGQLRDIDDILDILSIDLLGVIPEDKSIVLATDRGQPISLNRRNFVSEAYHNIAKRVMGDNVPLMDFREPGFFNSLARLFGR